MITKQGLDINHVVSVVGWGQDDENGGYWIARNSWGESGSELGYYTQVALGVTAPSCSGALVPPGDPELVEDLTYAQVALDVATTSCSGAMVLTGDPALVEDLAYSQAALEVTTPSGGHPALVEDLTYTQIALEITTPSCSGAAMLPGVTRRSSRT